MRVTCEQGRITAISEDGRKWPPLRTALKHGSGSRDDQYTDGVQLTQHRVITHNRDQVPVAVIRADF